MQYDEFRDSVELNDDDLIFIQHNDILYLDLEGKEFNYAQIMDQYDVKEKIGEGGFGSVYKIIKKGKLRIQNLTLITPMIDTKKIFAMKTIKMASYLSKASKIEELFREQKTLKQLDHNHIIKLHHAFQVSDDICLIMDYASGGEFEKYLCSKPHARLSEIECRHLVYQICRAVSY